ncbi:Elongator subunit elp6 [Actinomortierella ambigua]|nr:Elongator subunit elp6 [Actinomortierella ambigua]
MSRAVATNYVIYGKASNFERDLFSPHYNHTLAMGYPSLQPHLPASHAPLLPPGIHLSITDTQASDANFLLHHFISTYVKADQPVVLVGLAGILNHYTLVGRKLGVNLTTAKTKGIFHFVDGLTQLTDYSAPNKDFVKPTTTTTTTTAQPQQVTLQYSPNLKDIYKTIEDLVRSIQATSAKQLCLILDDVSILLNCGWPCRDVLALIRYLKLLCEEVNGSLVTLIHADAVMADEVDQDGLVKGVLYEADYIIDVRGLDSGGSRDVHGQISMLRGPGFLRRLRAGQVKEHEWPAVTLHYKVLDNNVDIFAKGFSSGVL